jgi:hypothetical protein
LTDLFKVWIVLWGILNFTPVKKKKTYIIAVIIQCFVLFIAGFFYIDYPELVTMSWMVMIVIVFCFLFEGKLIKKMAYLLLAYLLVQFLDACLAGVFSLFAIQTDNMFMYSLSNIINLIILGIYVAFSKIKWKASIHNISKRIYALLFAGAGTGILLISILCVKSNSQTTEAARRIMVLVTIIVSISYCIACLMMIFITESRDNYKALSLVSQNIIESQQQYYSLINEKQQEIRSIRHEMKNHLACIYGLYQSDKLLEMEQYIRQLIQASDLSADLFDTGNDIVNAILNDAQSRCRKDHIVIHLEGGFPEQLYIAPMDLCVIVANIISNAVEAIQRMERNDKDMYHIDLKISSFKDDLYIDVNNPCNITADTLNKSLITSKKDKKLHGFGIKNVIQKVEKYQGTFHYRIDDNIFSVEIAMKNKG